MTDFINDGNTVALQLESSNGERNKLADCDRSFHDWYRFVLSYPAHLVRKYLDEFELSKDEIVLDPFCGTGTTLVEAKRSQQPSIGIEANRFAYFASKTKVNWAVEPEALLETAKGIYERVISSLNKRGISDIPGQHVIASNLRGLNPDQERIILRGSISPIPLHKALVLLDEIDRFRNMSFHDHFRLAFANILVFKASNLRFGPEVGVGRMRHDVPVVSEWLGEIRKIAAALGSVEHTDYPIAEVIPSDSRNAAELLKGRRISAVITSPPYPNEKDYTRTTRLESVLLGFVNNKAELREMKKTLLRSNTRGVYKEDDDDRFIDGIPEIARIADEIEQKRLAMGKTSGFEKMYGRVTKLYFGGMAKHLKELSTVLKPGASLAYVVGDQASYLRVMIRTGELLARIASDIGYEVVRIDTFRTRFSTATKSDLNEDVILLRWRNKK